MPSPESVKKVLAEVQKRAANYQYFFDKLSSPDWIEPLLAEGMFCQPPEPEREGDRIGFPMWPESRYLARMAPLAPERVLKVALQLPDTENVRVHEDLCEAACAMPPELAAQWMEREVKWVESQPHLYFLLPDKLGELVAHLATGGEVTCALRLAEVLLAVLPDPRAEEPPTDEGYRVPLKPRTRFDVWHYREILKRHAPTLVDTAGLGALSLFCGLLQSATRFSLWPDEQNTPDDHSFAWRHAIEDHEQNRAEDLRDRLVVSVRDSAMRLIQKDPLDTLRAVEGCRYRVFQRIGLYLRRLNLDADLDGTAQLVVDREVLDDLNLHHEYYLLLEQQFDKLPTDTRQRYFRLVAEGLDLDALRSRTSGEGDTPPDGDEVQRRVRRWQFHRLLPVREYLSPDWRQRFEELAGEFQPGPHPEFIVYSSGVKFGPMSPKSVHELEAMSISELLEYLRTWQPAGDPVDPSPEGLGRQVCALVTLRPDGFARAASHLEGLDPTYVRAVFSGLRDALKQKRRFDWHPVLALAKWAVKQPREIPGRVNRYLDLDPGWGWTRKAIADLISTGTETEVGRIPLDLRDEVWSVLETLAEDPNPTPQEEEGQVDASMDPATLSINTTRGEAMHAVVRYAHWMRRHNDQLPDASERAARGFQEMPEVRAVLDRHLDPNTDPSLAIRTVYGQWLPWLLLLDRNWTVNSLPTIFPQTAAHSALRDAAWETYVTHCPLYNDVFDALCDEYRRALDRISIPSRFREGLANPSESLAEHLVTLYWRGQITLDSPDGLLGRFYSCVSAALRAHVIDFLGRSVHGQRQQVSGDVLDRLQTLWRTRIEENRAITDPASRREIIPFGWWFASKHFDESWAIGQLLETLELTGNVEPDHLVVERLAELAPSFQVESIRCLRLMIEGDREGWRPYGWREHSCAILETVINSDNPNTRQAAEDLIHRLGALGHLEYRDLLK